MTPDNSAETSQESEWYALSLAGLNRGNCLALKKVEGSTNRDSEQVKWVKTGTSFEQEESKARNQH